MKNLHNELSKSPFFLIQALILAFFFAPYRMYSMNPFPNLDDDLKNGIFRELDDKDPVFRIAQNIIHETYGNNGPDETTTTLKGPQQIMHPKNGVHQFNPTITINNRTLKILIKNQEDASRIAAHQLFEPYVICLSNEYYSSLSRAIKENTRSIEDINHIADFEATIGHEIGHLLHEQPFHHQFQYLYDQEQKIKPQSPLLQKVQQMVYKSRLLCNTEEIRNEAQRFLEENADNLALVSLRTLNDPQKAFRLAYAAEKNHIKFAKERVAKGLPQHLLWTTHPNSIERAQKYRIFMDTFRIQLHRNLYDRLMFKSNQYTLYNLKESNTLKRFSQLKERKADNC